MENTYTHTRCDGHEAREESLARTEGRAAAGRITSNDRVVLGPKVEFNRVTDGSGDHLRLEGETVPTNCDNSSLGHGNAGGSGGGENSTEGMHFSR